MFSQLILGALGLLSLNLDTWEIVPGNPDTWLTTSTSFQQVRYYENTTGSTVNLSQQQHSYNDRPVKVLGSTNTAPPWTAKFTPLTDGVLSFSVYSGGCQVPPYSWINWKVLYDEESGKETWALVGSNPVQKEARTRAWTTFNALQVTQGDLSGEGEPG